MAVLNVALSTPELEVEQWAKKTEYSTLPATIYGALVGKGDAAAIKTKTELASEPGGRTLTIAYKDIQKVPPIKGRTSTEGNENQIEYFHDSLSINSDEFPFRAETVLNSQETLVKFREDMRDEASRRWAEYLDESTLAQLAGNTADTVNTGNNTITAPTTNHQLFGGTAASEAALVAGDNMTLDLLYDAQERAETFRTEFDLPNITPAELPVGMGYWAILSPRAFKHLIRDNQTGQLLDIEKSRIAGGDTKDNVIFKRLKNRTWQYHGEINMTHIFTSPYVPKGVGEPLVDRNIFGGRQAGWVGFGKMSPGLSRFRWIEEEFDYQKEYGVTARLMWGCKKAVVNGNDLGVITLSTHRDLV